MKALKKFYPPKPDQPAPPDEFLEWKDISIEGTKLVAKDAVIRHTADESLSDWPNVTVEPGEFTLSLKLFRSPGEKANRVGVFRLAKKGTKPVRGKKVGTIGVDFALVGFVDYEPYLLTIRKNEKAYDDYGDDLFDLMGNAIGSTAFKKRHIHYVQSGYGDGVYPAYELKDNGKTVGMECDFTKSK